MQCTLRNAQIACTYSTGSKSLLAPIYAFFAFFAFLHLHFNHESCYDAKLYLLLMLKA
jgi:hypothetical protein